MPTGANGEKMYAVIDKSTGAVIHTYESRDAAIIAVQLEKDKRPMAERENITAVALDDGGFTDIMF